MAHRLVTLAIILLAWPAFAQRACDSYGRIEPLFHHYHEMLTPSSAERARAIARRVKLDIGRDSGRIWLSRRGLRPDHAGFDGLDEAVESALSLADLWLSGEPITPRTLRRFIAAQEEMGEILLETGCFPSRILTQTARGSAPNSWSGTGSASRDATVGDTIKAIERAWQDFIEDPPPWWALMLYASVPVGLILGLWYRSRWRRLNETRGFPRHIFTGKLTLSVEGEEISVTAADIGRGGTKVRLHHRLDKARRVELRTAGLTIPAIVSWQNAHFQGLSFLNPISRSELRAIRRQ